MTKFRFLLLIAMPAGFAKAGDCPIALLRIGYRNSVREKHYVFLVQQEKSLGIIQPVFYMIKVYKNPAD